MPRRHVPFLILACCAVLWAQEAPKSAPAAAPPATLTVQGHVFSGDGSGLTSATVTIESTSAGTSRFVEVTDAKTDPGHYASPALPAGRYKITASKEGYSSQAPILVTLDKSALVVDFVLQPVCNGCGGGGIKTGWTADFKGTF